LWVWNDMLTDDQIVGTMESLAAQGVKQVFVHPRPGLMTPYLSDEWFRLWKLALTTADRLDMNVWIYDENSYPSGFAGGWVPELMPESRGRGLVFREEKNPGKPGDDVVAVFRLSDAGFENVTAQARGSDLPEGRYVVAAVARAGNSPWHGGRCYVDLMYPGVTEKFLEVTLDAYKRNVGDQFGRRILGSFTDEPNVRPAGGLPWTDHLPQAFQERWGYSLVDHLPSLIRPVGQWKQVRHDYFQVVLEQFVEHWGKPYYEWCEKNKLAFTGHYWDHEWPNCIGVPDNMAMSAWQQYPGIDCLMNQYREDTHAQFGNVRMVKEVQSLCNQLGRKRFLCETYGAGGWDLRFEDMKRIADWLGVLGVNLFDEHLSYVTLRGARKADHPQSFSYHEPWWNDYHVRAQYVTRLSLAMSSGEQVNSILVLEPTTTAWMYQADSTQAEHLKQVGDQFFALLMDLERAQVEYDLGCEDVIAGHGSVGRWTVLGESGQHVGKTASWLRIGRRDYSTVVLPPHTESVNARTMELLEELIRGDGRVFCCGDPPALVDGRPSDRGIKLAAPPNWRRCDPAELPALLAEPGLGAFRLRRAEGDKGILFHQRRHLVGGQLLLLVNTSIEAPSAGELESTAAGVEQWDLATGVVSPYRFTKTDGSVPRVQARFSLPPCGSLLLFLSDKPLEPAPAAAEKAATIEPSGPMEVRRVEPNVFTIDYVDITAGGETRKALYFYKANQLAFQKNGMEHNPWDSAVQFRDELITKNFPPESGFEATYRFTIRGDVPKPLWIVIERPDLYAIACNGKPVAAEKGAWWLDKAFGKIDISAAAQSGENAVTVKASPMTIYHELEPAYVLGNFSLEAADAGFVIVPETPLRVQEATGWNAQGHPFYAAGVAYRQVFQVPKPEGRYVVALPSWYGSVARVLVNGKPAGHVAHQPWECDVTPQIRPGENTVEVMVIGTLKNTLGPHHAGAMRGSAWPSAFHQGPEIGPPPGAQYDTIGYGLFQPFVLESLWP